MEGSSGIVRALGATPRYGYAFEEDVVEPEGEYDVQEVGEEEEQRNKSKSHKSQNTVHDELEWMRVVSETHQEFIKALMPSGENHAE